MLEFGKMYLITLVIFFAIDIVWLTVIAKNMYRKEIGFIMSEKPNLVAALLFYLVFIGGLVFFVVSPASTKDSWMYALFAGMFFGFISYATYDLTNLATLENWPIKITIIDLIWGSFLGGFVSTIAFLILKLTK